MRLVALLTTAILIAGCGPVSVNTSDAAAADAGAAEQTAGQAEVEAQARPEVEVETFARELYSQMFEDGLAPLDEANSGLWTPQAWADIEAAWARDPGAISADPLCFCQDPTGMEAGDITARFIGDDTAEAAVVLSPAGEPATVTLRLKKVDGAWLIDDVLDPNGGSFRQALADGQA
ncbi:MAG: hypothetical protein J0L52_01105 [Caulobacterales bacterium]|nr:hypothetical protein [Caulobacterales bacterium]